MEDPVRTKARIDAEASQYESGDGEGGVASGNGTPARAFDGAIPDTGIASQGDLLTGIDYGDDNLIAGSSAKASHETSAREDREDANDDPLSQTGTYEGKRVFSPNELNQAGEDKEYFHPKDGHKFSVPSDATHHDLTPDVVLTPGAKPKVELKTDK